MKLCAVPAGKFWMGSDPPEGADNEHPRRLVETGAYEIGETPVTNAQFASFVQNYQDPGCWSPEGWAWREKNGIDKPRFYGLWTTMTFPGPITYAPPAPKLKLPCRFPKSSELPFSGRHLYPGVLLGLDRQLR